MSHERPRSSEPLDKDLVAHESLRERTQEEVKKVFEDLRGGNQSAADERLSDLKLYLEVSRDTALRDVEQAQGVEKENLLARIAEADYSLEEIEPVIREVSGS